MKAIKRMLGSSLKWHSTAIRIAGESCFGGSWLARGRLLGRKARLPSVAPTRAGRAGSRTKAASRTQQPGISAY
jgi:hypothetical protein